MAEMNYVTNLQTIQKVNEYFGVGVTSEVMDGVAPELKPGWVHQWINTSPEVRHAQYLTDNNEQT